MLQEVEYLGHTITAKGIQLTTKKICALVEAAQSTNVSQLKSFLGILNVITQLIDSFGVHITPEVTLVMA